MRISDKPLLAVPLINILPSSPRLLQPGKIYSYDVEIQTATTTHNLTRAAASTATTTTRWSESTTDA